MTMYGSKLLGASRERLPDGSWSVELPSNMSALCPVTGKSLELAFRYGYLPASKPPSAIGARGRMKT